MPVETKMRPNLAASPGSTQAQTPKELKEARRGAKGVGRKEAAEARPRSRSTPNHYPVHKWCGLLKTSIPCCLATSTPQPTIIRCLSSAQMVWTAESLAFLAVWPRLPQNQPLSTHYPVHKWCGLLKPSAPCYLARSTPKPTTIRALSSAQMVWTSEINYSLLFGQVHPKPINYVSQ